MDENFEDRAEKAAGAAGTLAGGASGAELIGWPIIRVPFVGPVVGAVVGGIAGNEFGRRLGRATVSAGSAFYKAFTSTS